MVAVEPDVVGAASLSASAAAAGGATIAPSPNMQDDLMDKLRE